MASGAQSIVDAPEDGKIKWIEPTVTEAKGHWARYDAQTESWNRIT